MASCRLRSILFDFCFHNFVSAPGDEIMHIFVVSGVHIQMSPQPPPFTMMGREHYPTALKITLSRG
jgi:hypothetical protein